MKSSKTSQMKSQSKLWALKKKRYRSNVPRGSRKRREARLVMLNAPSEDTRKTYSTLNKQVKKTVKRIKARHFDQKI